MNQLDFSTLAVHAGEEADPETGAMRLPVDMATTFKLPPFGTRLMDALLMESPNPPHAYTRWSNPTLRALEERLAALETNSLSAAQRKKIAAVVLAANQAGRDAGRPGVPCSNVDKAARSVIESAGYGQYFTHRTGHGLGLEGHEPPFACEGDTTILEPGMTFTVEPGIYLPGKGGVRVEDDIVITQGGCESLTTFDRELMVIRM
jgi:methionine aminopeptidase